MYFRFNHTLLCATCLLAGLFICVTSLHAQSECDSTGYHAILKVWRVDPGSGRGVFSIAHTGSPLDRVFLSQGNLQVRPIEKVSDEHPTAGIIYRFADEQANAIRRYNAPLGVIYNQWYDLFDYELAPWNDIPVFNAGDSIDQWKALSKEQWTYLFSRHDASDSLLYAFCRAYVYAKISEGVMEYKYINGVILLPDYYTDPAGITIIRGTHPFATNMIDGTQWEELQNLGVMFLPCTGLMTGTTPGGYTITNDDTEGYYWTATSVADDDTKAYAVTFSDNSLTLDAKYAKTGYFFAVRPYRIYTLEEWSGNHSTPAQ